MITIGISGAGQFAKSFIPLFKAHPLVKKVVLADVLPDRLESVARDFEIEETFPSHEALCQSDVDAVAIFAQRHLHGPMTLQALNAGKHVYCAVPIASSLDEVRDIVSAVEQTGLIYSNGETSYYFPHTIYCRERFAKGDFGEFVYGEGNYLHDLSHGFYDAFQRSGGKEWRKVAGIPPMHYPTHSTSLILSVTGARMTKVSCLGRVDRADDGVYGAGKNLWDNPFSDQTALMRTSDGGMVRVNEFRRVGWRGPYSGNPMTLYGTEASFESNVGGQFWTVRGKLDIQDLTEHLKVASGGPSKGDSSMHEVLREDFSGAYAKVHPVERLPHEYRGLGNGHQGSHHFLADDFVKSVVAHALPPTHVWEAAKYWVPGYIAHQSSLNDGVALEIPDLGDAPADWERLDPAAV